MNQRIYAFDWLRSIAFLLLIGFHSALLFTSYGWHLKLGEISFLNNLVEFSRPWRMMLIFLVSGVALSYSFERRGWFDFGISSLKRLLPPLVFGMFVVIPPVYYIETLHTENSIGLAESYSVYVRNFINRDFRWLHLWYLGYLLAFCAVVSVVWLFAHSWMVKIQKKQWRNVLSVYCWLCVIALMIAANEVLLRPIFPIQRNFFDDIASLISFFIIFTSGATLFRNYSVLNVLADHIWLNLVLSLVFYGLSGLLENSYYLLFISLFAYFFILTLVGCAFRYFNQPIDWVQNFNQVIFPFYLLHQIVILVTAFILSKVVSGALLYGLIVIVSVLLCLCVIRLIVTYMGFLHPFLGIQKR